MYSILFERSESKMTEISNYNVDLWGIWETETQLNYFSDKFKSFLWNHDTFPLIFVEVPESKMQ